MEAEHRQWLPGAGVGRELVFDGDRVSDWADEQVLELDGGGGCKTM